MSGLNMQGLADKLGGLMRDRMESLRLEHPRATDSDLAAIAKTQLFPSGEFVFYVGVLRYQVSISLQDRK